MIQNSFILQWTNFTLFLSIVGFLAVLGLSWTACRRSGFRRSTVGLEMLRISIVSLALLILNQPESVAKFIPSQKPTVVILGDASLSMTTRDAEVFLSGASSLVARRTAIEEIMKPESWSGIGDDVEIKIADFASNEKGVSTNLHEAITKVRDDHPNLRALVLASDGDWNEGSPPVDAAMRLRLEQIPIFSIPVGSKTRLPDVDLLSFDVPTFGVVNKTVRIPFTIESSLNRDHVTQVILTTSDGTKLTHEVRVSAMGRTSDTILWKPEKTGDELLTLEVPQHPEERLSENNKSSAPIAIREEKLRVLVIESLPRWEYRYLRNALSRDPGVEVSCLLFHPQLSKVGGGNRDYIAAFPEALEDLSRFDVVFLGDVGVGEKQLTDEQCRLLKGLVEQQASGLVLLPGIQGNWQTLVESPLGELMPVNLDSSQPTGWGSRTPSHFGLTDLGRRSLLTKLADTPDENIEVWENLPGFQWHAPVIRAKAGTDVLCVHQESSNEYGRIPLIVTRTFGAGKVLFMGTDGAWRWRRGVEDLYHYRFWGQVVRWMAYQRNMAKGESMRFYFSPEQPQVRQTISLSVNAMEKSGEPLSRGEVQARITAPSGRVETVTLTRASGEWGAFSGIVRPMEPGEHKVLLSCKENGQQLEAKIFVQGAKLEQIGKPARPEVLEELSRVSRGRLMKSADVNEISQVIRDLPRPQPQIRRVQLWSHPLVAATLITMLGVFWVLRKAVGLI